MSAPMTLTFHGMAPKEWIAGEVRAHADQLEEYCGDIMSWRVAVDLPHRHHKESSRFSVRIELRVPGEELVITHGSIVHGLRTALDVREWVKQFDVERTRTHLRVVIDDAFDVARRRLQAYARRHRRAVRKHGTPLQGAA
jgi:hypothetical protein